MYHAEISDFETVKEIFYLHKKWFPHIRTDYMKRMIAKKNLILENDVVITYNFYKRKQKIVITTMYLYVQILRLLQVIQYLPQMSYIVLCLQHSMQDTYLF